VPFLADRFGFRLVAMITGGLVTALFIIPVVAPGKGSVLASYTIFGGAVSLSMPVLANLGAELVPSVRPATIIAVGSSLTLPLTLAVAPAAGRLADLLGKTGYLAAFIMGATLAFCSLLGFVLLVREPRTGQEIHVRFRPARPV
jgi:MFS family permease